MDPDVINAKLESLARCVRRIESRKPVSASVLAVDLDSQDIIVLNLERAVQVSVDIGSHLLLEFDTPSPESMAGVFFSLGEAGVLDNTLAERMAKAAGFRNIAVHEYESMDWDIVFSIIMTRLDDFRDFAIAVTAFLGLQATEDGKK
jgi:uncharacterized protein YutE (UPF0331/DUF86 family)